MKILALETSAKSVSCAVVEDGAPLASAYQCTGLTHSRTLLPMVDAMLKNADLTLDDINAIAIAAGPGSFTGLRIGIAAVNYLAFFNANQITTQRQIVIGQFDSDTGCFERPASFVHFRKIISQHGHIGNFTTRMETFGNSYQTSIASHAG